MLKRHLHFFYITEMHALITSDCHIELKKQQLFTSHSWFEVIYMISTAVTPVFAYISQRIHTP